MYSENDDKGVVDFVLELSDKAAEQSDIFPVDRKFLLKELPNILAVDTRKFVFYNLDILPNLYVSRLFVCLPEIWGKVSVDNILEMANEFSNVQAYFKLLSFTYKYVEIDLISQILNMDRVNSSHYFHEHITSYLRLQWNTLIKSESDYEDFKDGFIDVDYDEWMYIKQKFLVDKRIKPALTSYNEVKDYIEGLVGGDNKRGSVHN